jgi:hypothetical protein
MRKPAFFAAVVCLISCCGMNADAQPVQQSWGAHFVGPSRASTTGDAGGFISMNQLCKNTYGTPAHMCNVEEFYSTAGATRKSEGLTLWVRPAFSNCVFSTAAPAGTICIEEGAAAGSPATLGATCSGWTSAAPGSVGTTVNTFTVGQTVGVTNV